jgi:hypothetical protein
MRSFIKTVVLCILVIFINPLPASAQDEPDWAAGVKKEDSLYKYYVGRAVVEKSERDAFNQSYEDARDQAIRENFGVKTAGTHQSYEDQQGVRYTSRVNDVYPGEILIKDFEMIDSFKRSNTLYCLYRYRKEAISQEKQRLEKSTPIETPPAYTSSKGTAIRKGGLDIKTTPEDDVQVIIDNEPYGKTPVHLEHKLDPGQHTLRLEHPFYYTITEQLIVPENEVVVIHKTMNRATGTLKINTRPVSDAKIFIDGNLIGNSPLEYNVYAGISSKIVAEHPETESMITQVELTRNEYKVLALDLVLKPSTISIYSNPPGSTVYIDGEKAGDSPVIRLNVPAHRAFSVRINKEGYVDQADNLVLEGGENKTINLDLKPLSQRQKEQQEGIAAREEALSKAREAQTDQSLKRDYHLKNFPWVISAGIAINDSPFIKFDSKLVGYDVSVEKRLYGVTGLQVKVAQYLDWNSGNVKGNQGQSLYGTELSIGLPLYFWDRYFVKPEAGRQSAKAKTVSQNLLEPTIIENANTKFMGLAVGIAPYKGGGADLSIGARKYSDSNGLKGRVIVAFVINAGLAF